MRKEEEAENMSLATELLHELKASAKRWFIVAMAELAIILAMAGLFIWYISLPVEEYSEEYNIENDDGNANFIGNDLNRAIYNGENNGTENISEAGN